MDYLLGLESQSENSMTCLTDTRSVHKKGISSGRIILPFCICVAVFLLKKKWMLKYLYLTTRQSLVLRNIAIGIGMVAGTR